jgi:hypothetical protein
MKRVLTKDARDYNSQLDTTAVAQQTNVVQCLHVHRTSESYFIDTCQDFLVMELPCRQTSAYVRQRNKE